MVDADSVDACLKRLMESLPTLSEGWDAIHKELSGGFGIERVQALEEEDYFASYDQFREWLLPMLEEDPIPRDVEALIFGVFRSEDGMELFLAGTEDYEVSLNEDDEWSAQADFFPDERFAALDIYRDISPLLEENYDAAKFLALAVPVIYATQFAKEDEEHLELLIRRKGLLVKKRDELYLCVAFDEERPKPFARLTREGFEGISIEDAVKGD